MLAREVIIAIRERIAFRRRPHVDHLQTAAAFFLHQVEVIDNLVPARHLAIRAQLEAKKLLGRRESARRPAGVMPGVEKQRIYIGP